MTEGWRVRAASLAQAAQQASTEGELGLATTRVQEALAVIEAEGSPKDLVFGSVLLVAADLSLATGELETAEPLYDRVAWVCDQLDPEGTNEGHLGAVRARAYLGMARADAGLEEHGRARQRYQRCLEVLASLQEPTPPAVTAAIRAELAEMG
jgi:hypothetical protein